MIHTKQVEKNILKKIKMRLIMFFISTSMLFRVVYVEQLSKLFQLVKPNRSIVDSEPIRVETTQSITQCLMELDTVHSYFIEIEKKTDSNNYVCKMFRGEFEDHSTVPNTKCSIYGSVIPKLCQDVSSSTKNGVYMISAVNQILKVYCDMEKEKGGWTTIQRRVDGSVSFQRDWADYKKGFGDPTGNYWLGLENIHAFTNSFTNVMLRIEASTFDGERAVLIFEGFKVDNETNLYKLSCGQAVENPLSFANSWRQSVNGMFFSTRDMDNDIANVQCAQHKGGSGGQWYKACAEIYFNAEYPAFAGEEKDSIIRVKGWKSGLGMKSISVAVKAKK